MAEHEIAELVMVAISDTDTIFRAANASVQVKGHGYMVTLPPAEDAGFRDGDTAPVIPAPNMLVIVHGKREAHNGTSELADALHNNPQRTIQSVTDWDHTELRRLQTITAENDTQSPTPSRVIRVSSTDMLRVDVDVRRAFRAQLSREKIRPIVATPPTKSHSYSLIDTSLRVRVKSLHSCVSAIERKTLTPPPGD